MKLKTYTTLFLLLVINVTYAQVGIGTTSPNASSMLDITSTNSGLLIPRVALVSASDVTTIASPVTSLLVYNSGFTPNGYYYWNGSIWVQLAVGSNTDWSLTGNTGTNSSTNFLGTTDDVDIVFKRFNVRSAFIGNPNTTSGNMNTSFGANSLLNPSGARNVAVGTNVLPSNTTGNRNTSVGERSMFTNTTGSFNTAFGAGTLFSNLSGDFNTAIGRQSLTTNSNGLYNTALGNDSGYSLISGSNNIFIGYRAGYNETGSNKLYIEYANLPTDSSQNNAIIYGDYGVSPKVLRANAQLQVGNPSVSGYAFPTVRGTAGQVLQTDGAGATSWASASSNDWGILGNSGLNGTTNFLGTTDNVDVAFRRSNVTAGKIGATSTAFGVGALNSGVATNSTAFGNNALSVSTGNNNVAVGQNALQNSASTAQWNTAVGTGALKGINNAAAQDNVAIGFEAMGLGTGNISNTTAVGSKAMQNSTGANNTAIGYFALAGAAGTQTGTENTAIGISSMRENVSGASNTGVGSGSLQFNQSTSNNVGIGFRALRSGGGNSVAVGNNALLSNTGANNTALGHQALGAITTGVGNVAIGNLAGSSETGASSNKLYIENSNADASNALIYGEFDNNIVRVNGTLQISNPASAPGYALPNVRGTNGQVLQTNGAGTTSWVDGTTLSITEIDPQVSSTTSNVVPKWDGTSLVDGVMTDDGTNVGVGITPSAGNKLEVNGKTKTTDFQMTTGAAANYILQSDATGNASWAIPNNTLSVMRTNLGGAQSLGTGGWQLVNFDTIVFDSNTEFNIGANRFVAAKTGYYEVNAGFHTNNQSNTQFYSIGVYKNGSLYQQTSGNHSNLGPVSRTINCIVSLSAGDFIEIYAENYQSGVNIDSYIGKTFFEVKQIK